MSSDIVFSGAEVKVSNLCYFEGLGYSTLMKMLMQYSYIFFEIWPLVPLFFLYMLCDLCDLYISNTYIFKGYLISVFGKKSVIFSFLISIFLYFKFGISRRLREVVYVS